MWKQGLPYQQTLLKEKWQTTSGSKVFHCMKLSCKIIKFILFTRALALSHFHFGLSISWHLKG